VIRQMPGRQEQQQHRDHLEQAHQAQRQRILSSGVHQPADGHGLHLEGEKGECVVRDKIAEFVLFHCCTA
jgi:uncharacterized protein YciI